jgi:sulfur carrier protein
MIAITVNGETRRFDSPLDLTQLLDLLELTGKRLAVERNGEIVPRSQHATTPLADGDQLEIVVAVGGG